MSTLSHLSSSSSTSGGRRSRNAGISLPFETLKILDELRGDIPKSTFTLRLIERALKERVQLTQQPKEEGVEGNPPGTPSTHKTKHAGDPQTAKQPQP